MLWMMTLNSVTNPWIYLAFNQVGKLIETTLWKLIFIIEFVNFRTKPFYKRDDFAFSRLQFMLSNPAANFISTVCYRDILKSKVEKAIYFREVHLTETEFLRYQIWGSRQQDT